MNEEEKRVSLNISPRVLLHNFLTAARHLLWLVLLLSIGVGLRHRRRRGGLCA